MARSTISWLLDPIIPAAPGLPRLAAEAFEPEPIPDPAAEEQIEEASTQYPSGTWCAGTHREALRAEADSERFATSDREAPTVRPGALHSAKVR